MELDWREQPADQVFLQVGDRAIGFYWDQEEQRWRSCEVPEAIRWNGHGDEALTPDEFLIGLRGPLGA